MAKFDSKTFSNLQKLCRIKCAPEEEKSLSEGLTRILSYIEQLKEVPTDDVEPCYNVLENSHSLPLREDVEETVLKRELFLENAPDKIGGMIKTPPILNGE